jgi:SHS2 domain-containing protein
MDRNGLSGYREIQHTADVAIEIWSDTLIGIIREAYEGLTYLVGCLFTSENTWTVEYRTGEGDFEDQVIAFLNEIIYLLEKGTAVKNITIMEEDDQKFKIVMTCCKYESGNILVKAVTYNGLKLISNRNGYRMKIVFDV